jgi:hypothetical protein
MTLSSTPIQITDSVITSLPISSTYGADYYVRQLIINAVQKDSNISSFYKHLLRNLKTLFGNFYIKDSQNELRAVKCVHGLPERAIAKQLQENSLVLPLISIIQTGNRTEEEQRRFNPTYSAETIWDDKKQRAMRVVSLVPKAITVEYDLSVWAAYNEHLDQLTEQIQKIFNPFIEVNLPFTKYGKIFLVDETSEINKEISDQEDRTLVRTYRVKVETHLPNPKYLMTNTGQLEIFNVEGQIYEEPRD